MKKIVFLLFAVLIISTRLPAQVKATLSAAAASCATTNVCLVIPIPPGSGTVTASITANASGNTIQFEVTNDAGGITAPNNTWVAFNMQPSNSTTLASSSNSSSVPLSWQANPGAYTAFRMRMSMLAGGTTTVVANTGTPSAHLSSGGGGGVTSFSGDGTIITNSASTGAVTATIAGTSGGVPYFNSSSGWASSGALTANVLTKGGGAGSAPTNSSITDNGTTVSTSEPVTLSANGALSASAITETGTAITSGTGTTTFPYHYYNCTGATAPTTWSTSGTIWGMNTCSGFNGNLIDLHINGGGSLFNVDHSGNLSIPGAGITQSGSFGFTFSSRLTIFSPGSGILRLTDSGLSTFTRLALGLDSTSFPALCPSGTTLQIMVAGACTTLTAVTASTIQTATQTSATNCAANGTAANPSVAACGSARAGMFSCATNASTGTCQVNTTAVTANSEITITQNAADGGASQLNVTCNTANDLPSTAPILASKSGGASFTINVGTISTNPACFEYTITN